MPIKGIIMLIPIKTEYNIWPVKAVQTKGRLIIMMKIKEMKEYCIKEIKLMGAYNPLLEIFYVIIKDQGKTYQSFRSTWIKDREQQMELFKEI